MSRANLAEVVERIQQLAHGMGGVKTAAAAGEDPGTGLSFGSVDDGNRPVVAGPRAREHEDDLEKIVSVGAIDGSPPPPEKTQATVQPQIGLTQSETGGDPAVEDNYTLKQRDPGTTSPARADDAKTAFDSWSLDALAKEAAALEFAVTRPGDGRLGGGRLGGAHAKAAAAGYADADKLLGARELLAGTIKEAIEAADAVIRYMPWYLKAAAAQELSPEELAMLANAGGDGDPGDDGSGGDPAHDPALAGLVEGGAADDGDAEDDGRPMDADEAIDGVNGAADDMQLSPEQLQALVQMLEAQGGIAAHKAASYGNLAAAAAARRRSGNHEVRPPKTAREREIRRRSRVYLAEIMDLAGVKA